MSQELYRVDIDALFADYVKDARVESGPSSSEISRRLFVEAAAIAAEDPSLKLTFIECRSREHLVESMHNESLVDSSGLGSINILYTVSLNMFRALMAAWHCGSTSTEAATAAYAEKDFLIWKDSTDLPNDLSNSDEIGAPDYMFIDGFDAVADIKSMGRVWALLNNTLDYINRVREKQGKSSKCQLVIGLVSID